MIGFLLLFSICIIKVPHADADDDDDADDDNCCVQNDPSLNNDITFVWLAVSGLW